MDEPAPGPTPRRRWMTIALIVSLGLNLAVAGLVAGLALKGPPGAVMREGGLWQYGYALPDPYRRDLVLALRETRSDWIGPRAALRARRAAFAEALTADPFDPAAAAAALRAESSMAGTLADKGTELLIAQIVRMSPDERLAYAEAILRGRPGRKRRGE